MKELIVWAIHTPAGTIGLIASIVILFTRKGTPVHRRMGRWFTVSMLIMLISAFVAAVLKNSTGDMVLSAVITYTVFTAWLTTYHKKGETGVLEYVALTWIVAIGVAAVFLNSNWLLETGTPNLYPFWAIFAALCAFGDIRNLRQGGLSGTQRIVRHVWRIGFSLLWAALALTDKIMKAQGSDVKELPQGEVLYIIVTPIAVILFIIVCWLLDILFFSSKKYASHDN